MVCFPLAIHNPPLSIYHDIIVSLPHIAVGAGVLDRLRLICALDIMTGRVEEIGRAFPAKAKLDAVAPVDFPVYAHADTKRSVNAAHRCFVQSADIAFKTGFVDGAYLLQQRNRILFQPDFARQANMDGQSCFHRFARDGGDNSLPWTSSLQTERKESKMQ